MTNNDFAWKPWFFSSEFLFATHHFLEGNACQESTYEGCMTRNGHLRTEKRVPLKKMHENHGFLHVQQLSGCLGTPREAPEAQKVFFFFLFSMCLGRLRQAAFEPNFMAQLRTRARFPRSTLEIHCFFSSEMKPGKQMCRTVCVFVCEPSFSQRKCMPKIILRGMSVTNWRFSI